MQALDYIVRSGRALYVGISNYNADTTQQAITILRELGTPLLIHQPRYNMFDRWIEDGLTDILQQENIGSIVFSPLAQGVLTDKYLKGIPEDSRAARADKIYLGSRDLVPEKLNKVQALNVIANSRGQSLAQMAIAWTLHNKAVTTCLVGASSVIQLENSVAALNKLEFSEQDLIKINAIIGRQNDCLHSYC
jgi:L-glyceraldehyde 3-phosphate reductase